MLERSSVRSVFLCLAVPLAALAQVKLTVTPASATLHVGNEQQFAVKIEGATSTTVTWAVDGVTGGNSTVGTVSTGRYTPPAAVPSPNTVTVTVTHSGSGTSAGVPVTVLQPYPMLASVLPATLSAGPFAVTVNGSGFVSGARVSLGDIPLATAFVSATRLVASGTIASSAHASRTLSVTNPEPGGTASASAVIELNRPRAFTPRVTGMVAARFLEQAAFGPDRASIEDVQRLGFEGWIDAQFSAPVSPYQDAGMLASSLAPVQARFFTNAVHGADQLRQRVAFALGQIWVVSGSVASTPARFLPYLRVLQEHAFGNYRDLMKAMTLNPAMGDYLNMVNNVKAGASNGTRANENYARELLQLFTLGTSLLNPDGTVRVDGGGNPYPTYTQKDIQEFSRALTGWTYPTMPGAKPAARNAAYYVGPMEAWEANHDAGEKTLLNGAVLPANQTAAQDLDGVLDNLFAHPNLAPFVCRNLIQHLVTSNPSPAYVKRVTAVFEGSGWSDRGGLSDTVRAILLDEEARTGDGNPDLVPEYGHLREPVLWMVSLLRALGALLNDTNSLASRGSAMGQNIFYPPTVFNYYMPGNRIPGGSLLGPEFQLLSPATALERANQANTYIYGSPGAGTVISIDEYSYLALSPNNLLDGIESIFFHGQMPADLRKAILQAVIDTSGERAKAQAALYLAATSGYYAVQR